MPSQGAQGQIWGAVGLHCWVHGCHSLAVALGLRPCPDRVAQGIGKGLKHLCF